MTRISITLHFTVSSKRRGGWGLKTPTVISALIAHAVLAAVRCDARPRSSSNRAHIFPVRFMAQPGAADLAGNTESGCYLARLAGQDPASVIVEI